MSIRSRLAKCESVAGPDPREVERERRQAARRARADRLAAVEALLGAADGLELSHSALLGLATVVDGDYWLHDGVHHPLADYVLWAMGSGIKPPLPRPLVEALLAPRAPYWHYEDRPDDGPFYADRLPPPWLDLEYRGCRACGLRLPAAVTYHGERVEFPFPACPVCSSTDLGCLIHGCKCRDCYP